MPGIRQIAPIAPKATGVDTRVQGVFEAEISKTGNGSLQAQINMLSRVDPLAYYCALVLVGGMDELVTGGGYCQVDGRRYYELAATIRAWDKFEAG